MGDCVYIEESDAEHSRRRFSENFSVFLCPSYPMDVLVSSVRWVVEHTQYSCGKPLFFFRVSTFDFYSIYLLTRSLSSPVYLLHRRHGSLPTTTFVCFYIVRLLLGNGCLVERPKASVSCLGSSSLIRKFFYRLAFYPSYLSLSPMSSRSTRIETTMIYRPNGSLNDTRAG